MIYMAQTALAYRQPARREYYRQQPERRTGQQTRRELQVLTGKGIDAQNRKALAPALRSLFKVAIVSAVVLGLVFITRVAMTEATMSMLVKSEQLSQSIAAERLAGTQLEVEYSKTSSPATVQTAAVNDLGMAADDQVEYLRISTGG
ncbi:MAG TPA: hypothetical protein DEB24_00645 [Coriobacteriia bacterium]|nr:hypothetical protein [Coriobacteriia bacterium]